MNASEARAPSAARLAAEAFFAPAPTGANQAPMVDVTVVRHEKAVSSEPTQGEGKSGGSMSAPRAPRVFRLDAGTASGLAVREGMKEGVEGKAMQVHEPQSEELPTAPLRSTRRLPRKKAPRRHGEVTIIRPEVSEERSSMATPEVSISDQKGSQAVDPVQPQYQEDWPRYPALLRKLQSLQAQAAQLRQSEVAVALRWIKVAIREHGITAQELGLR